MVELCDFLRLVGCLQIHRNHFQAEDGAGESDVRASLAFLIFVGLRSLIGRQARVRWSGFVAGRESQLEATFGAIAAGAACRHEKDEHDADRANEKVPDVHDAPICNG